MMDLSTAYRYNQNMMEYYTCKLLRLRMIIKLDYLGMFPLFLDQFNEPKFKRFTSSSIFPINWRFLKFQSCYFSKPSNHPKKILIAFSAVTMIHASINLPHLSSNFHKNPLKTQHNINNPTIPANDIDITWSRFLCFYLPDFYSAFCSMFCHVLRSFPNDIFTISSPWSRNQK